MSFATKVYRVVSKIPKGKVMTYQEVATFAGNKKAYRAVGRILNNNPDIKKIPCHRVIRSDFKLGGYAYGGTKAKRKILKSEGVNISKDKVIFKK